MINLYTNKLSFNYCKAKQLQLFLSDKRLPFQRLITYYNNLYLTLILRIIDSSTCDRQLSKEQTHRPFSIT